MHQTYLKPGSGYSLIEAVLSVAIVGMMATALVSAFVLVLEARVHQQVIAEVEQQGTQAMQIITQTIRNSDSINYPAVGTVSSDLSLDTYAISTDPTIFDLSSGVIRTTQGTEGPVDLTALPSVITGLQFSNLSQPSTPGVIRIQFTVTYSNPSGRQEYTYSKNFYGSASLR